MPPDPRDWLPEGHLAWFVLASVGVTKPKIELDSDVIVARTQGREG